MSLGTISGLSLRPVRAAIDLMVSGECKNITDTAVKVDLLDSNNAIARDPASSFVLGFAGIQPASTPSVSLNLEIKADYIIDVSPEPGEVVDRPSARTIPHE